MLSDLTAAWHAALAESVDHDIWCRNCTTDAAGRLLRCAEGSRLYDAGELAWQEMQAAQYLGVA